LRACFRCLKFFLEKWFFSALKTIFYLKFQKFSKFECNFLSLFFHKGKANRVRKSFLVFVNQHSNYINLTKFRIESFNSWKFSDVKLFRKRLKIMPKRSAADFVRFVGEIKGQNGISLNWSKKRMFVISRYFPKYIFRRFDSIADRLSENIFWKIFFIPAS